MSGTVQLGNVVDLDTAVGNALAQQMLQDNEDLKASMSPAGALNLPPLIDARRLEYGLPDSAFSVQASFETVYVWQIPIYSGDTFSASSKILKPDQTKSREAKESPRGIIVSAGLTALDALRSHGMDVGHIVTIIKLAPYRVYFDIRGGKQDNLLDLRVGDIHGSLDTSELLRAGKLRVVSGYTKDGGFNHHYVNAEGDGTRSLTNPVQDDD